MPITGPPTAMRKKCHSTSRESSAEINPFEISMSTEKMTTAVPSFRRDSPSIVVESETFAPSSRSKATTATGSVAEVMVPRRRHKSHVHDW